MIQFTLLLKNDMIYTPKEVEEVWVGNQPIQAVYIGDKLVFENATKICFANGYWVDEFPWDDNSYWMD